MAAFRAAVGGGAEVVAAATTEPGLRDLASHEYPTERQNSCQENHEPIGRIYAAKCHVGIGYVPKQIPACAKSEMHLPDCVSRLKMVILKVS